jgi:hypothetical protein
LFLLCASVAWSAPAWSGSGGAHSLPGAARVKAVDAFTLANIPYSGVAPGNVDMATGNSSSSARLDRVLDPARYMAEFSTASWAAGEYLYRFEAGGQVRNGRMIVLR